MTKTTLEFEIIKMLCDYNGEEYIQKYGEEYIEALNNIFELKNNNDKPFTLEDVKKQPCLKDFEFIGVADYRYICKLRVQPLIITRAGKRINERLYPVDFFGTEEKEIFDKSLGVSYLLTCEIDGCEHIIKIGSSRTTFRKRLGSYNCGVINNWRTASTTNIKILQSMVTIRKDLKLYIYDCSDDFYVTIWHGVQSVKFASPKALAVEDIMVKKFIAQFGFKPLANIQVNATEVTD